MAEKNIISKPFTITRKEGSVALQDIFYVETRGKQTGNTFLPPDGKSSADLNVYRQISLDEYNGVLALGGENRSLLKAIPSSDPNNPNATYLIKNATIENNQVTPTQVAPERILTNPNQLLLPSTQSSQDSIIANGLTNNANISPNTATPRETTSTPINVPTSQADVNLGSSSIKRYPINMKDDQDRIEFTVWEYADKNIANAGAQLSPINTKVGGKVETGYKQITDAGFVYLPVTKISDTNSVDWQDDKLNEFQRLLANSSLGLMGGSKEGYEQGLSNLQGLYEYIDDPGFGNMVRLTLAGQAVQVNSLLTRATGAIINPNLELLFNSPSLRQFGFGFDLLAKNETEAGRIKEIIKFFKENMAVRDDLVGAGEGTVFLKSPYVFRIKYLAGANSNDVGAKPHQSIGRIKMCALQSCTTDYTPMGSYMTFKDGTMFMYRINLQFKELTPVYSSDYSDHPIGF